MKVEKLNRRIQISIRYGDPLQPKIKARRYKWDPTQKVWWKGYTDKEMEWAQAQLDAKQEAAARFAERRENSVKLDATYKQTVPVKDDLKALGCFLDSTGERVFSRSKGKYVFAKAWYAPRDKADRAKAIIQHGGAASADAAAEKAAKPRARTAQAEAARYDRTATGRRRNIRWQRPVAAQVGDVIHTKTAGWALVVEIISEYVSARDIEEREDRADFSGRRTPGVETRATVIPVNPTPEEVEEEAEKTARNTILKRYDAALRAVTVPADDDRDRPRYAAEYDQAAEMKARLESGEKAVDIVSPTA